VISGGVVTAQIRSSEWATKKEEWHQAEKVSLDLVLTPLEKMNLLTIQAAEAQAGLAK
jgi:hypothetical protein